MKKYRLHCFGCGYQFSNKDEVIRVKRYENKPYCGECMGNMDSDQAAMEVYDHEWKKWLDEHPGVDYDQYLIDENNKFKYGEY